MARLPHNSFVILSTLSRLLICTQAHMQMSWPYPLRSPLDPEGPDYEKDYDMTFPLFSDGSNFACKHYQNDTDSYVTKATYVAGGTYDMWLNGTATHNGGSCQLSLSYDNGITFKVIKSMIGGCPLVNTYNFTVPSFAPASDAALLSWSWFNIVGNREMYQNCARVQIVSSLNQRYQQTPYKRPASSLDQLPDMFTCNIGNGCQTIEGQEVVFPNPGDDVIYGQDAIIPNQGPGITISGAQPTTSTAFTTGGSTDPTITTSDGTLNSTLNGRAFSLTTTTSTGVSTSMTTDQSFTSTRTARIFVPLTTDDPFRTTTNKTISTMTTTSTAPPFPFLNATITSNAFDSGTGLPNTTGNMTTFFMPASTASSSETMATMVETTLTTTSISIPDFQFPTSTLALTSTSGPTRLTAIDSPSFSLRSFLSSSSSSSTYTRSATRTPRPSLTTFITRILSSSSTPSSTSSTPILNSVPCVSGTFTCNSATSFSQCISTSSTSTTYIYMGSVAAGMQCVNGQIIRQNAGPCTPFRSIFCNGEHTFYTCDQGGLVDMGPVAPGMACRDGEIVFA
ncbi:uncharacterized protein Z518_10932 [Rhinocladiella mackenziei CBS 650.93]|uniref:Chitin-binding type-4 domain-containing protein n=1 Tax=Rhinocladiella mackenziei CBS 650.93 TaxID=1442369 RepID=A0A0D2ITH8_9EURO|nr:uncharacterized protein Z518_10932 [Rhinocladiella mackenziei CBS 650.93]KIX00005.1 hypothetical protein Z518_10932 [Rhinocladiella mackenziei CBS 650.93]